MTGPTCFGAFMPPFHLLGQSPGLALQRDLELIEHMDRLGYDEVWIGEHHSGGFELIASPEVFIAHAAARTRHIRLGTGVLSLPYHHPFLVADRMVLLDHLTHGRAMLGVGPGQLISDAHMLGIVPEHTRRMLEESLEAILALLAGEIVTRKTDWFELRDARLQLRPFTRPRFEVAAAATISPIGPTLAGRHGLGLLSLAATNPAGFALLARHWEIVEEQAQKSGASVDRSRWRMTCPFHLAETEAQARRDVRHGLLSVFDYLRHLVPMPPTSATSLDETIDELHRDGGAVIGTPERAIEQIERLVHQSGGFGGMLLVAADFADRAATLRSYEIFAERVMPHFRGQLEAPRHSHDWVRGAAGSSERANPWLAATERARVRAETDYAAGGGAVSVPEILTTPIGDGRETR
jgi:limonene 1,2-monooxygenase